MIGGIASMNAADAARSQYGDPDHSPPEVFAGPQAKLELMFQPKLLIE
jgi:hypothetical protein